MRADVHMHTSFSYDSNADMKQMIEAAINKGLGMICFTEHYDKDSFFQGEEEIFDVERYMETLLDYRRKYQDRLDIRMGVELGLQPHLGGLYSEFTRKYPFDFVIGSVHSVQGKDPAMRTIFEEHSDEEVYRMTFEEMLEDVQAIKDFDVLGHIDYVVRYSTEGYDGYSYEKYMDIIEQILKEIITSGRGIELNMAGLRYGLPFAHPHPQILKRYKEMGGEIITIGADAHRPEHIAYDFQKASDILKGCGFKYYTEFSRRKPHFKQLP